MEPNAPCDHPLWNLGCCALSIRPYIVTSTGHDARTVNGQPVHQGCSWRYPPYSVVHRGYEANLGAPSCSTSKMYSCTAHLKVDSNGHTVYPSTTDSEYSKGRLPTAKRTGSRAVVRRLVYGQTEVQLV